MNAVHKGVHEVFRTKKADRIRGLEKADSQGGIESLPTRWDRERNDAKNRSENQIFASNYLLDSAKFD
jgi:hypothetical protein